MGREGMRCGGDSWGEMVETFIYFRLIFRINSIVSLLMAFDAVFMIFREQFGETVSKGSLLSSCHNQFSHQGNILELVETKSVQLRI